MSGIDRLQSACATTLSAPLSGRLRRAFYWYPGTMAASAEPEVQLDSQAPVHTAALGVVLVTEAAVVPFCWRMEGSDEWLGIDPPWCSNEALPEYWVVDATAAWRHRGLIDVSLSDVSLLTYPGGTPGSRRDVVGVVLTFAHVQVGIVLADFESGRLTNTADTVAVVFSRADLDEYIRRSDWQRHRIPVAEPS